VAAIVLVLVPMERHVCPSADSYASNELPREPGEPTGAVRCQQCCSYCLRADATLQSDTVCGRDEHEFVLEVPDNDSRTDAR
jgi:hypothetical protein